MMKLLVLFILLKIFVVSSFTYDLECSYEHSVDISEGKLFENGSIEFESILYLPINYETVNYKLLDGQKVDTTPYKRGCICQKMPCINIDCTRKNEICNRENATKIIKSLFNSSDNIHLIYDGLKCDHTFIAEDYEWRLQKNRKVYFIETQNELENDQFAMQINKNGSVSLKVCSYDETSLKFQVYPIVMMMSIPFALVTIIIYSMTPELLNSQGKALICYLLSLVIAYSCLSAIQFDVFNLVAHDCTCITIGYITYLASLSIFFWVNVICYDIWQSLVYEIKKSSKFTNYYIWGWGMPLLLLIVAIVSQQLNIPDFLKPDVGKNSCYLDDHAVGLYLHLPLTCLILCNFILFIRIVFTLWNSTAHENSMWSIFLSLFFIMGIPWAMEIISWATTEVYGASYEKFFFITDLWNCSQGIIVFIIFVCNHRVMKILMARRQKHKLFHDEVTYCKKIESVIM